MAGTGASRCCAAPLMEPVLKGTGSSAVRGQGQRPGRVCAGAAEGTCQAGPLPWRSCLLAARCFPAGLPADSGRAWWGRGRCAGSRP